MRPCKRFTTRVGIIIMVGVVASVAVRLFSTHSRPQEILLVGQTRTEVLPSPFLPRIEAALPRPRPREPLASSPVRPGAPGDLDSSVDRGKGLLRKGDVRGAIALLKKQLALHPEDENSLVLLAAIYAHDPARRGRAEAVLEHVLDKNPSHPEALTELLTLYHVRGKVAKGNELLETLTRRSGDSERLALESGYFFFSQGRISDAITAYRRAAFGAGQHEAAVLGLAQAMIALRDFFAADEILREAEREFPKNPELAPMRRWLERERRG